MGIEKTGRLPSRTRKNSSDLEGRWTSLVRISYAPEHIVEGQCGQLRPLRGAFYVAEIFGTIR